MQHDISHNIIVALTWIYVNKIFFDLHFYILIVILELHNITVQMAGEKMEIIKVKGNTYCIDTGMTYLPFYKLNNKDIILMDSGYQKECEGIEEALEKVRAGKNPKFTAREKHKRVCYVVPCEGADLNKIEETIKTMPNYFADYDTTVNFISEEEFKKDHCRMPHGGFVIRTGNTSEENKQRMEFSLTLDSNPEFTSSVLLAYARAIHKFSQEGRKGAVTVFDIPFGYLSPKSPEELRKELL